MSAESVGQIGLDLVVNKNDFEKQMGGVQNLAKKAGKALAAAFAVKKLVSFGAACIELGSDLQEVQNVVDVTFPSMSKKVDEFAQNAAASFGLSETMAKKFTGTFGAMAKAFGFSESAAYDMSTTLTGLAGDVASFYNITQDEAYTKLKSVFTGETESLKDLGVVMTQTALDSYALANGFGKTTAKMTEAEKVALRYKFVQEQLTGASGDFVRTSDGWANQVRVLKLQFDSLKATIGQGLINVLTPVIKVINTLVGKLMTLANAFKSFTEMITGKKGTGDAAAQMQSTAKAADGAAASTKAVGDAAAESAKKMKGLFAFDDMNVMSSDSGGDEASAGYSADAFDMGTIDTTAVDDTAAKYQTLIDKTKELADLFRQGFQFGFGNTDVLDNVTQSLKSIKDSILGIFTSSEVQGAFDNFLNSSIKNAGVTVGAFTSVGASIIDNLLGGISGYLEKNTGNIQDYFVFMFDIGSRISELKGNFSAAVATVAESIRSDGAVRITESLIGAFTDAFMGVSQLCGSLAAGLLEVVTGPFIDNQDKIRSALEKTFSAVAPVFEDIKAVVDECVGTFQTAYDEHIGPMLTSFRDGLSEIVGTVLDAYNTYILPVVSEMSEKFGEFKEQYLSPLIEKFGEFAGKVADAVNAFWTNALKPALEEFITTWAPVVGEAIKGVGQFFSDVGALICTIVDGLLTVFGGLMDFITGIFTGNWEQAWQGIKDIFSGIFGTLSGIVSRVFQTIRNTITSVLDIIKAGVSEKLNSIKNTFTTVFNAIKGTVTKIFNGIWNTIKNVINSIIGGVESMANGIVRGLNTAITALNKISFSIPDWVPALGGKSFGFSVSTVPEVSIPRLWSGGYVKANTPQLAMIGDNMHQGEIVAPEDKMYQISAQAMKDVMQQFMSALAAMLNSSQGREVTLVFKVTGEMAPFVRLLKAELDKEANRAGVDFKVVYE